MFLPTVGDPTIEFFLIVCDSGLKMFQNTILCKLRIPQYIPYTCTECIGEYKFHLSLQFPSFYSRFDQVSLSLSSLVSVYYQSYYSLLYTILFVTLICVYYQSLLYSFSVFLFNTVILNSYCVCVDIFILCVYRSYNKIDLYSSLCLLCLSYTAQLV